MTNLFRNLLIATTSLFYYSATLHSQCASGTIEIKTVTGTPGTGSYSNPALNHVEYEFCFTLTKYLELSTNWVHGIFVAFEDIPDGFTIVAGTTGAQHTQASGNRNWVFFDSTQAANLGLPGPGYYVDDNDMNPTNNYGDNGLGTPMATFPNLAPFCLKAIGNCGLPRIIRPCITVTGDGTTGAWRNPDCNGDQFCTITTGPNNDGTIIVCGNINILSLQLNSFTGYGEETSNQIEWSGVADNQFEAYELEKSIGNGNEFKIIYKTGLADPNSSALHYKSYVDLYPAPVTYYRLKMISQNKNIQYSKTLRIENKFLSPKLTEFHFNQISNEIFVKLNNPSFLNLSFQIFDLSSNQLYYSNDYFGKGLQNKQITLEYLQPGVYFLSIFQQGEPTKTYKFIKT